MFRVSLKRDFSLTSNLRAVILDAARSSGMLKSIPGLHRIEVEKINAAFYDSFRFGYTLIFIVNTLAFCAKVLNERHGDKLDVRFDLSPVFKV